MQLNIAEIESVLKNFKDAYLEKVNKLSSLAKKAHMACQEVGLSWSQSFAGYHGLLYYEGF